MLNEEAEKGEGRSPGNGNMSDLSAGDGAAGDDVFWAQHDPAVEQRYAGQWVVPLGRQIVSHGTELNTVLEEAARVTQRPRDELVACAIPHPNDWLVDA